MFGDDLDRGIDKDDQGTRTDGDQEEERAAKALSHVTPPQMPEY